MPNPEGINQYTKGGAKAPDRGFPRSKPRMQTAETHGGLSGSQFHGTKPSAEHEAAGRLSAHADALSKGMESRGGANYEDHHEAANAHAAASTAQRLIGNHAAANRHSNLAETHHAGAAAIRDNRGNGAASSYLHQAGMPRLAADHERRARAFHAALGR